MVCAEKLLPENDSENETPLVPSGPERMREANCRELLRLVRQHSPCSRADLVRYSGLTAPTVSAAIAQLHERGLVDFIGDGASSGGRPPRLLQFNAHCGYVFGADIGGSNVRLALADLNGALVGRWSAALRTDRSPQAITNMLAAGIAHLQGQHGVPAKKVLCVSAGAPGITDVKAGRVISAPNLTNWDDVPFRQMLEAKTGHFVCVENDVNLGALGESWSGVARHVRNFVFLAIGTGVGAGIVINGKLHHGSNWSAGEIGYLLVPGLPSRTLDMNSLGILESTIGGHGIEKSWAEVCNRLGLEESLGRLRATEIFDRAQDGDERAREILFKTAEILAQAIINLSIVLNMSLAVLGGAVGRHPALLETTQQFLNRHNFPRPQLVASNLGVDAQLHGAIRLALQSVEAGGFRRRTVREETRMAAL
jgi:predicted NBD/HSP70 family sugar kinase